jgi:hypothetical protein
MSLKKHEATPSKLNELLAILKGSGWKPELGPWQTPTLSGSWTHSGAIPVQYAIDSMGIVHLAGIALSGSAGTVVFTLPTGFRPPNGRSFPVAASNAYGEVTVQTTGNVVFAVGSAATGLAFDGISFSTA